MFAQTGRRAGRVRVGGEGQTGQGDRAARRGHVLEEAAVFELPGFEEIGDGAEHADGDAVLRQRVVDLFLGPRRQCAADSGLQLVHRRAEAAGGEVEAVVFEEALKAEAAQQGGPVALAGGQDT